jgi:ribose 5-phosphate isomerase A
MDAKEAAARKAVEYVQDGMTLGLGTGSTAAYVIQAIGERVQREELKVRGVPTSVRSREMAAALGIPLADLSDPDLGELDLTIDGADEVDRQFCLIKGGGGALLREKIVASAGRELIIVCDSSKIKPTLGAFPLPVAVAPFGHLATLRRLQTVTREVTLRVQADGTPYVTDDGLYIYDLHMQLISDPPALERRLKKIVGVVEVGLFVELATRVVVGYEDGHTEELTPPAVARSAGAI